MAEALPRGRPRVNRLSILVLTVLPQPGGRFGTELVAHDLAARWAGDGHTVTLAGHARVGMDGDLDFAPNGVAPAVLPALPPPGLLQHFTRRSPGAPPGFEALLAQTRPDVAVVVGFGPGSINLSHLGALTAAGVPATLWHHVAGLTCQQHGLRLMERGPCDGRVLVGRCAACRLTQAGLPEPLARVAARSPFGAGAARLPGPLGHVLGGRALSAAFARSVEALAAEVAHTFVGAHWVREVLVLNGFDPARISLVRPGLRHDLAATLAAAPRQRPAPDGTLRLAYWGRIDDAKGIDTAIHAVRALPGRALTLSIAGTFDPTLPFHAHLATLAGDDPRIAFLGRLEADALAARLAASDVALIPSPVIETGPLTVFEAHGAGLPILGARTGGIAEICGDDPSARLFLRNDHGALAVLIDELVADPVEVARRAALVPPARTMADAADEIAPHLARLSARAAA